MSLKIPSVDTPVVRDVRPVETNRVADVGPIVTEKLAVGMGNVTVADRTRLAEPPQGKQISALGVRMPDVLSGKATFNDNLCAIIDKLQGGVGEKSGTISPQLAVALFDVTREGGISPRELADAEKIAQHFAARSDPNASVLTELAAQIRAAYTDQGFLTRLAARLSDIGKRDLQPSLSREALEATRPSNTAAWITQHVGVAKEIGEDKSAPTKLIMCPVLGSLIREGSLELDANGCIDLREFNTVMITRLGITPQRAAVTVATGFIGNHLSDAVKVASGKLDIDHLKGSILDHVGHGDTAILQDGVFHEDKFQVLCAHSSDGKTLCIADFAAAINDQLARDGGFVTRTRGASEDIFEMAALINTFGYVDDEGDRRIAFDTLRDLYQHQRLPAAEELRARKATGVIEHVATMSKLGVEMAKDAVLGRDEK